MKERSATAVADSTRSNSSSRENAPLFSSKNSAKGQDRTIMPPIDTKFVSDTRNDYASDDVMSGRSTNLSQARMAKFLEHVPDKLSGIAASKIANPLVDNQLYLRVGRNTVLEVRPSVVHFGGYTPGLVHSQLPSSPYFSIRFKKKGWIGPGMSEDVTVEFTPQEMKYYSDEIKVHCPDENLVIPVHAYPIMNTALFPTNIDFGTSPVGYTVERIQYLRCKVPIDFDYELTILNPSSEWNVAPLCGVVPGRGKVPITISFTPRRAITSSLKVKINISQFGFEPFVCTIAGSGGNMLLSDEQDSLLKENLSAQNMQQKAQPPPAHSPYKRSPRSMAKIKAMTDRAKAIKAEALAMSSKSSTQRAKSAGPNPDANAPKRPLKSLVAGHGSAGEYIWYNDTRVPTNLDSVHALNYILNQEQGKMQVEDLNIAIAKHRAEIEKQEQAIIEGVEKTRAIPDSANREPEKDYKQVIEGDDYSIPVPAPHRFDYSHNADIDTSFVGNTPQMKEMIFLRNCNEYDQHEKTLLVNPTKWRQGSLIMSDEQKSLEEFDREEKRNAEKERIRALDRKTVVNRLINNERPTFVSKQKPEGTPTWDVYDNNNWDMRKRMLNKFVQSINKLIVRQRTDSRLKAIKQMLAERGFSAQDIEDDRQRDDAPPRFKIDTTLVANWSFPVSGGSTGKSSAQLKAKHQPVPVGPIPSLRNVTKHHDKDQYLYRLLGYQPHEQELLPSYVPMEHERPLRTGALEEILSRGARGEVDVMEKVLSVFLPDGDTDPSLSSSSSSSVRPTSPEAKDTLPNSLFSTTEPLTCGPSLGLVMPEFLSLPPPMADKEAIRSAPGTRVYSQILPMAEDDPTYKFRPTHKLMNADSLFYLREVVGTEGIRCIECLPTVSQEWRPHQDASFDQHFADVGLDSFFHQPSLSSVQKAVKGDNTAIKVSTRAISGGSATVPSLLKEQPPEDILSDEEGDFEKELAFQPSFPTREMAQNMWAIPVHRPKDDDNKSDKSTKRPSSRGQDSKKKKSSKDSDSDCNPPRRVPIRSHRGDALVRVDQVMKDQQCRMVRNLTHQIQDGNLLVTEGNGDLLLRPMLVLPFESQKDTQE